MTIKEYLNSKQFKKEYKCWHYAHRVFDEKGNDLYQDDSLELYEDENWENFVNTHEVLKVEMGWELGDDHESYAFAKITTRL